jgi:hypothetical protein
MLWSCFRSWGSKIRATVETVRVPTDHRSLTEIEAACARPIGTVVTPYSKPSSMPPSAAL